MNSIVRLGEEYTPPHTPSRSAPGKPPAKTPGGSKADGVGRMKGAQLVKPVVYGNVAWYLGQKRDEDGHTHQWKVYLQAYDHEDMSVYVKRVHFKLHDSYPDQNRVCHAPPYQVTETGWGEFEIAIKIFFQDSSERPVTIYHFLKLFEREEDGTAIMNSDPVKSEFYDELMFTDPTIKMHCLLSSPKLTSAPPCEQSYEETKKDTLEKILDAKRKLREEIENMKNKLTETKDIITRLKKQVKDQSKFD